MKKSSKPNNNGQEQLSSNEKLKNKEFKTDRKFFNTFDSIFLTTMLLILVIYLISYYESISWQFSSIGRILLIKILPYYDWTSLKNEKCLINRLFSKKETVPIIWNCDMCEDIIDIDVHKYLEEDILEERYLNIDKPVIFTRGLEKWPNSSKFIKDLLQEDIFIKSYPCNLATNIFKGIADIGTILSKQKYFDRFFIHFQNCEINAVKVLRKYVFRPDILPSIYSPTLYNWLIWNKNYNVTNYKQLELVEKVTAVGQLFGSTNIRLVPRKNCENVCPFLSFSLHGGEMLIFTSLWDMEYKPNGSGENMAVVMEY